MDSTNNERIEKILEWFESLRQPACKEGKSSSSSDDRRVIVCRKRKLTALNDEDEETQCGGKKLKFNKDDSLNYLLKNLKSFKGKGDNYLGWFENTTRFLFDLTIPDTIKLKVELSKLEGEASALIGSSKIKNLDDVFDIVV